MTILNIANDGLFNVLLVICRILAVDGPIQKDKLIDICSNKQEDSVNKVRQTLTRWTQLGMFVEKDGVISLCPLAKEKNRSSKNPDNIKIFLPSIAREIVFKEENNENFWDREKTRTADFSRALSWILAQDIYTFPLENVQNLQAIESRQVKDTEKRPVQNDVRLNGLRYWAHYLGFTSKFKNHLIDPTQALKEEAGLLFKKNVEYSAKEFLEPLAEKLPVIDGGIYRKRVEEVLDPQNWQKPSIPEMLSTSLSRALWRLELAGIIDLVSRADARANRVLQRQNSQILKSFTHVVYRGEN
jgi:hypothetical protein